MNEESAHSDIQPAKAALAATRRRLWLIWTSLAIVIMALTVVLVIMLREEGYDPAEGATIIPEDAAPPEAFSPLQQKAEAPSHLTYGEWTGEVRFGQPHGQGTLTYSEQRLVSQFDPNATVARPGDYVIGEFDDGQLISGRLYRTNGQVVDLTILSPTAR